MKATIFLLAGASLLLPWAVCVAGPDSGAGVIGEWHLAWRISDAEGIENHFRAVLGEEIPFPIAWRRVHDMTGPKLLFFDEDGDVDERIPIDPNDEVLASDDGSAFVLWSEDLAQRGTSHFRYFVRGESDPIWEARAQGEPILMAPDGNVFVVASRGEAFLGTGNRGGGALHVVDSNGDIRGEFPIYPRYAAFTADLRRIVFLNDREIVVLRRDGILDWRHSLEIDNILPRIGTTQLATGYRTIAVGGTGAESGAGWTGDRLYPDRRGQLLVFDDSGELLWKRRQSKGDETHWFQLTCAVSADGERLVTSHFSGREIEVRQFDARTGELLWSRNVSRDIGYRALSIADDGELTVMTFGSARTTLVAWDGEGTVVWEGSIPLASKVPVVLMGPMLVAEKWIAKLTTSGEKS